jgi:hypothetical protein
MAYELTTNDVWDETEYFLKCSDCESEQEGCFNPQQAIEIGKRDGWRSLGPRAVCPTCAVGYPAE